MEEYNKGLKDGKNSVNKLFMCSAILSVVGWIFIYGDKPKRSLFKEFSDEYFDGYYSGVMKRRWGFWFIGMGLVTIFLGFIIRITQ